jgi:hypothetical protein
MKVIKNEEDYQEALKSMEAVLTKPKEIWPIMPKH